MFGGYLRSQVKCTECGAESNTFDANLDISLDIKHARSVSRALAEFTKPEILDRANMYMCAKCKRKVVAHKRFTIHTTPAVLAIHLKRFDFTYRHGQVPGKPPCLIPRYRLAHTHTFTPLPHVRRR